MAGTMDVTPLIPEGRQVIEGYGEGKFRISGAVHEGPVIVFPERALSWPIAAIEDLSIEALSLALDPGDALEILLLGCGSSQIFVTPSLRAQIRERGPVLDSMDTGAACRTYNVLLSEGRRVAAALMPVA
jgi:uncharacterized protein